MEYPFITIKKIGDEWWYHGADKTLDSASKNLFYTAKKSGGAYDDMRIVQVNDMDQYKRLGLTVNLLPDNPGTAYSRM